MPRFDNMRDAKKNVEKELSQIFRAGALEVFAKVIQGSPVGKRQLWKVNKNRGKRKLIPKGYIGGNFRGNWQASVNTPIAGILPKAYTRTERLAKTLHAGIKLKDILYLTNNLPYAQRLEEGHSTQRPNGWVRTTVAAGEASIQKAAALYGGF